MATNDARYRHGLVPTLQAERFARRLRSFRNELLDVIIHALGCGHPSEFTSDGAEVSTGAARFRSPRDPEGDTPARQPAGGGPQAAPRVG